jgi:hypothetical protein
VDRTTGDEPATLFRQGFTARHLQRLRRLVAWAAQRMGLDGVRGQDMVLAVNEAATNAIRHGGGAGELELIQDDSRALIAQISDDGPGMPADAAADNPRWSRPVAVGSTSCGKRAITSNTGPVPPARPFAWRWTSVNRKHRHRIAPVRAAAWLLTVREGPGQTGESATGVPATPG